MHKILESHGGYDPYGHHYWIVEFLKTKDNLYIQLLFCDNILICTFTGDNII